MKVMVLVKATNDSEAGKMPSEQLLTEMGNFNQQLIDAGILLAGEGLHPSSQGVRVKFSGTARTVTNGPFAATQELLAGYWLWQVNDMAEAIEWVRRCPNPHESEGEIEIRQVFSAEDFGDSLTPAVKEQEAALRAQSAGLGAVRFENLPAMLLGGRSASYTRQTRTEIPVQWKQFVPFIGKVPGQIGSAVYGVAWNGKRDGSFNYLSGVEIKPGSELPADFLTQIPIAAAVTRSSRTRSTFPKSPTRSTRSGSTGSPSRA